ncbi:autotransporter outer membrane beta-barrel domain-containing protein [Oricola thermophila]|uniref:Autotransporter domain-containing protein n=1 Tax=Oricola thermophila TaxID=2742145 RepID=A0A6N1VFI1_9HYPH|nr:autotransporter domain-containing protein [Oricola thermophila]QKV17899.1 autotransporter domain-containing protein [Oricola thermophila]
MNLDLKLWPASALCALMLPGAAMAADFTIVDGQTETMTQTLSDPGDVGTVEAGGTISTAGDNHHAVRMNENGQSLANHGRLETSGGRSSGILSGGDDAVISNSGVIETSGGEGHGITSGGDGAEIGNSGTIETSGIFGYGIRSSGADAEIENSGAIETSRLYSDGIWSHGANAVIGNFGTIRTSGLSAEGIWSDGANAAIDNSGVIETSGDIAEGIDSSGANATVSNSGTISTSGYNADGIWSHGANAVVLNSGTIATSGDWAMGIYHFGADSVVLNSGTIETSGISGYGIRSSGADAEIENSGAIETSGLYSDGIWSHGANAVIGNFGTIRTSGLSAEGIWSDGANAAIDNSGVIETSGDSAEGIDSSGANATVSNSGTISTSGDNADGIWSHGANAVVLNSGAVETSGDLAYGILSEAADATIGNTGTIVVTGAGAAGVLSTADGATVTNSGTIASEQDNALELQGSNATVNLLAGSVIRGGIEFGQPGTATLNIGPGLNTALTVTGMPATVDAGGRPLVVSGGVVAVVDPVGFAAAPSMIAGATGALANSLDRRMRGPVSSSAPSFVTSYFPVAGGGEGASAAGWWGDVFGGVSSRSASGNEAGYGQLHGGAVVGFDREVSASTRAGLFAGGLAGRFAEDNDATVVDMAGIFGGAYARHDAGAFFADLSVTGGVTFNDSDRQVLNNLAPGGIETATASYSGVFASPSLTVGRNYEVAGATFTPSLRARYAGIYLDGYTETGSAAALTVDSRVHHVFDLRAQVETALVDRDDAGDMQRVSLRAGVDGIFHRGDDVDADLLGTGISFASGTDEDVARGFVGVDAAHVMPGGRTFNAGFEVGAGTDSVVTLDLRAGLRGRF